MPTVDTDEGQIACEVVGHGDSPWIVMSHGMGLSRAEFRSLADRLADRWQVLLWDMPGHGESAPLPRHASAWPIAQTQRQVMAAAGVSDPVLLGFSFGGVVAQIIHHDTPGAVRALALCGAFTPYLRPPLAPPAAVGLTVAALYGLRRWPSIRDQFAARCALTPAAQAFVAQEADRLGKAGLLTMTRALMRATQPDPDYRIRCPLLLVRGAQDSNGAALSAAQDALALASDDVTRVVIPAAGHCAHLDQPEAFEGAVSGWLNGLMTESGQPADRTAA